MIRKAFFVLSILAAAGTAVLSNVSKSRPLTYYRRDIVQPTFWMLQFAQAEYGKLRISFESLGEFVLITEQDVRSTVRSVYPPLRAKTLRERLADIGFSAHYYALWSYGVGEDAAGNHYQLKAMRRNISVGLPAWFLVMVLASYPSLMCMRALARRLYRKMNGLCIRCSYDLTGNISGTCPECGTAVD